MHKKGLSVTEIFHMIFQTYILFVSALFVCLFVVVVDNDSDIDYIVQMFKT